METKNLSNPQTDTDAQFVTFRYPAESKERPNGNPALGERMIFLRKTGSVSPKETICFSERNYLFLRKFSTEQVNFLFTQQKNKHELILPFIRKNVTLQKISN